MTHTIQRITLFAATLLFSATLWSCCNGCAKTMSVNTGKKIPDGEQELYPAIPAKPPYAKATINHTKFDFGDMEQHETGKHRFLITNSSKERELIIHKGKSTCKCAVSKLSKAVLKPGESADIDLEWTIDTDRPIFEQTANILTSDPKNKLIRLTIHGNVVKKFIFSPGKRWVVGKIVGGKKHFISGTITSTIYDTFQIEKITTRSEQLKISHTPLTKEELKKLDVKSGYKIQATLLPKQTPNQTTNQFSEKFTIHTKAKHSKTGQWKSKQHPIEVQGTQTKPLDL